MGQSKGIHPEDIKRRVEMEYTKGEWKVIVSRRSGYFIESAGKQIAEVPEYIGSTREETEANVHFIATAPDLYEACKLFRESPDADTAEEACLLMDKAIAKAEG